MHESTRWMGWFWVVGLVACSSTVERVRPEAPHPSPTASVVEVPAAAGDEVVVCSAGVDAMKVDTQANPEIERACQRAVARDESCGEQNVAADCEFFARAERSGVESTYMCIAALPCAEDTRECWRLLPPSTVGRDLCSDLTRCTPSVDCDETAVDNLNTKLAWLNDETIDLLRRCIATPDCDESDRCISHFVAIYLPSAAGTD